LSILRTIIDQSVFSLGWALRYRKVHVTSRHPTQKVCVNLGCGLAIAPGWVNVDASLNALFSGFPCLFLSVLYQLSGSNRYYRQEQYIQLLKDNQFVFYDLSRGLPFYPNSIDFFYSSHFLEHLFLRDAMNLLQNKFTALRSGGVARIAIPDLEHAVALYHQGKKREMLSQYFFVDDKESFLARHKYMYDFDILSDILAKIGFINIHRCDYQQGMVPDLDQLDNRPEETLFVEAMKP
jgi:predicted SAM-dependent methyltransferase